MSCLRVTDVNAVQQDGDLFVVAAAHTHIGLCTDGTALSHIHAHSQFQQIVYTLYCRRLNIVARQYRYHSHLLTLRQRRSRSHHTHPFEHHLSVCADRVCRYQLHVRADAVGGSMRQRSHTQYTDNDLTSQTREQRVALVGEVRKLQNTALVENWFVHCYILKQVQK